MGLKVRKSIKIAPGVKVNLSSKSVGMSFGGKGATYSISSSGRRTATVGIPGTGISYSSTSRSKHSSAKTKRQQIERQKAKAQKEEQKRLELEHAKLVVEEYETKIDAITSIHRGAHEKIVWEDVKNIPEPFAKGMIGPKETKARKELAEYKPGFLAKRISSLDNSKKAKLESAIQIAAEEDKKLYDEWEVLHNLAVRVLSEDIDAMLEAIQSSAVFEDLTEYGSGFEIGFLTPKLVEVEFDIMADEVVPKKSCSLTATGKLSEKNLPVSKRLDIMQDYVCSTTLRIARELFAVLPLDGVVIHARDSFIDTSLGNVEPKDILSVYITPDRLNLLNFDMIDPSDSMVRFEHNMKFLKTKGFQPISRISIDV